MSFKVTAKDVTFSSLEAIHMAVADLVSQGVRISVLTNAKPRMHLSDSSPLCPIVLRADDGAYDVGLMPDDKGGYNPIYDYYKGHVKEVFGHKNSVAKDAQSSAIERLKQIYAKQEVILTAQNQGYQVADVFETPEGEFQVEVITE